MNSPPEIARLYSESASRLVRLPIPKLIILSLLGSVYISTGALCSIVCTYRFSGGDGRYYRGLIYPLGLMLCLCAGGEIFSGNCLLLIPFLNKKIYITDVLFTLLIVFIGNLIGGIIMSVFIVYSHIPHLFDMSLASLLVINGEAETSLGFGDALVKGILGSFCTCLAILCSYSAQDLLSKIAVLWAPICLFIACGFEDCTANMFYIPAGLFSSYEYDLIRDSLDWGRFIYKSLIPVLLGNIIGGTVLVGLGFWYLYLTGDSFSSNAVPHINNDIKTEGQNKIKK